MATRKRRPAKHPARRPAKSPPKRPSGLTVALAFGVAIAAAVALVVLAVVARTDGDSPDPSPTSGLDLAGIPQDGTVLGSPDANVTLIEYADLQCPACRAYAEGLVPGVVDGYVRPGDVKTEFRGLAFIGDDSVRALRLVLAAGLQDRLWNLQDAFYRNQGGENTGWVTDDLVRDLAADIDGLDVDQLFAEAESSEVTGLIDEADAQAEADEVGGTPTLFIQVGDAEPYVLAPGLDLPGLEAALDDALGR